MGSVCVAPLLRAFSNDEATRLVDLQASVTCDGRQLTPRQMCWEAGERIVKLHKEAMSDPSSSAAEESLKLQRHQMSMFYRRQLVADREQETQLRSKEALVDQLRTVMQGYKKSSIYPGNKTEELTHQDELQIIALAINYPWVAESFLTRQGNRKQGEQDPWIAGFVKFCLRSCGASGLPAAHWVDIFVKYPDEVDALTGCHLDKRLGATNPDFLQIQKDEKRCEYLAIKVDGLYVPFQGDKTKTKHLLKGVHGEPLELTWKEICEQMKAKTGGYFDVEVLERGISNWNAIQLCSVDTPRKDKSLKFQPFTYKLNLTRDLVNQVRSKECSFYSVTAKVVAVAIPLFLFIAFIDGVMTTLFLTVGNGIIALCNKIGGTSSPSTDRIVSGIEGEKIKVEEPDWLYKLPVWRRLTQTEVNSRYGRGQMQEIDLRHGAAMAICGTRLKANYDIADTHGFLELILQDPDDQGLFRILPMGFQPTEFPGTLCGKLTALQRTTDCMLHYPDESVYLTHRQRYSEVYPLTPEDLQRVKERLTNFVTKARAKKKVFQPTGINCARHVTKLFQRTVGLKFTEAFEKLVAGLFAKGEIARLVKQVNKNLDSQALALIVNTIKEKATDPKLQADLIMACLEAIQRASSAQVKGAGWVAPDLERVQGRIEALNQTPEGTKRIQESLGELVRCAFDTQQFYNLSLLQVEVTNPLLGPLLRAIKAIPWEWLKDVLLSVLLFILGSWRGYSYKKKDEKTVKTLRCWSSTLHKEKKLFLPAGCFEQPTKITNIRNWVDREMFIAKPKAG